MGKLNITNLTCINARPIKLLNGLGLIVLLVSLLSVLFQIANTERYREKPEWWSPPPSLERYDFSGCGWDGVSYCQLFYGGTTTNPIIARRTLPPKLAHLLSDSPLEGFTLINTLGLTIAIIFALMLIRVGSLDNFKSEFSTKKNFYIFAILISVIITSRNTFHLLIAQAVTTDQMALGALIMGCYFLINIDKSRLFYLGALLTIYFAPMIRENISIPLVVAASLTSLNENIKYKGRLFIFVVFGLIGTIYVFNFSNSNVGQSAPPIDIIISHLTENFSTYENFLKFFIQFTLATGFYIFLIFNKKYGYPEKILFFTALSFTCISIFGGADIDRILMPTGILLCILTARFAVCDQKFGYLWSLISITFIISQSPFVTTKSNKDSVLQFFGFRYYDMNYVIEYGYNPVFFGILVAFIIYFFQNLYFSKINRN